MPAPAAMEYEGDCEWRSDDWFRQSDGDVITIDGGGAEHKDGIIIGINDAVVIKNSGLPDGAGSRDGI